MEFKLNYWAFKNNNNNNNNKKKTNLHAQFTYQ